MSSRGPDWDFYQCKCGNIVFEYNIKTGEKCLTDTWKNCTTTCMEPVSYVPPCARPFTTVTVPVSRPQRSMATQTGEDVSTRSVDTQTPQSTCACNSSTVLPKWTTNDSASCDTNEDSGENESRPALTSTTAENKKDLSKEKNPDVKKDLGNHNATSNAKDSLGKAKGESTTSSPSKRRIAKAKEEVKGSAATKNGSDRILRKRKSDLVDGKGLSKEATTRSKNLKRKE